MPRYRVPVVVFTEVDAVDLTDAVHIAERAVASHLRHRAWRLDGDAMVLSAMDQVNLWVTSVQELSNAFTRGVDRRSDQLVVDHVKGREVVDPEHD